MDTQTALMQNPTVDFLARVQNWPMRAESLDVVDIDTAALAGEELVAVKKLQDEAHLSFDPICAANYNAWQVALSERKKVLDPLMTAEATYKARLSRWAIAESQRVREEQRLLETKAIEAAEVQLEQEIELAEAQGATPAEIESMIDRPLMPLPMVATPAPKLANGISAPRANWKGEITDKRALVEFIVKNNRWDLLSLLTTDDAACNSMAKAVKNTVAFPGVRFFNAPNISVRR